MSARLTRPLGPLPEPRPRGHGARPAFGLAFLARLLGAGCVSGLLVLGACGGADAGAPPPAEPPPRPAQEPPPFDAARAWQDLVDLVAIGPRQTGTAGAESARGLIEARLQAAGYETQRETFVADTPAGPLKMANVLTDLPAGSGAGAPWIVLCTHFDTKRIPPILGANDGGSGTAVLLELARALRDRPSADFAYRFLFLDGEEAIREQWQDPDNRYGSRHHADRLERDGTLDRVAAVVLIDLVGDRDLVLERETLSDQALLEAFFAAARDLGLGRHVPAPGERGQPINDDHVSFLAKGVRAVDLIDFDYGPYNRYWHTAEDTLEHCSAESLGVIGRIVLAGLPRIEHLLADSADF